MPATLPPLIATYRLQLGSDFTFADVSRVIPYLAELGISHLYLSPVWEAVPGSTHGYDVVDHERIAAALGGAAEFYALGLEANRHGLGLILDLVPNHVGIRDGAQPWWRDVLRFGQRSPYAQYFDIYWGGQPGIRPGVLTCPVLGKAQGAALEDGELTLIYADGELAVRYFDGTFPVAPATYGMVLGMPSVDEPTAGSGVVELLRIVEQLRDAEPAQAEQLLQQFRWVADNDAGARTWVESRLRSFDGTPGQPGSFDRLDAVLGAQHYRLAHWRVSGDEVNYRRFFDINELAAIRQEYKPVFDATHGLLAQLAAASLVAGVRVDHVDGLYDPPEYLRRLRGVLDEAVPTAPIWVEKILAPDEALPHSWPVAGTTGYDFLARTDELFADPGGVQALTETYVEFTGQRVDFDELAFEARRQVADRLFSGEVQVLAVQLRQLSQNRRLERDHTLRALRDAIVGVLAELDVYRTYLEQNEPRPIDRAIVTEATAGALHRDPTVTIEAIDFLERVLLLDERGGELSAEERAAWVHFRRRFQQLSSPVMAKGMEDTAFFRFHQLLAANEVGGRPARTPRDAADLHEWFRRRLETEPDAMSGSSTHDTKRGEDARLRLWALTETPRRWRRTVRSWSRLNSKHQTILRDEVVPDSGTEYAIYQTLVASWDGASDAAYRERIRTYVEKSLREAKLRTSWTNVIEDYEQAVMRFVDAILDPVRGAVFLGHLAEHVESMEPAVAVHRLSYIALKMLAPGVPDLYQGAELPLHTLTDPDNRRPVDFEDLTTLLAGLPHEALGVRDPRAKLWLTRALLSERRRHPDLYARGAYEPLMFDGPAASHFFGFMRRDRSSAAAVVVPVRVHDLVETSAQWRAGSLDGTRVVLPDGRWHSVLVAGILPGGTLDLESLLSEYPIAVLRR